MDPAGRLHQAVPPPNTPTSQKPEQLPLFEQPNPYAEWLNKRDLALAALQKLNAGEKLQIPSSTSDNDRGANGHAEASKTGEESNSARLEDNGSLGTAGAARRAGSRPAQSVSK